MNVIMRGRRSGKTTDLIRIAALLNMQIITADSKRAETVKRMAQCMGVAILSPVGINEFINRKATNRFFPENVLIDDADAVLEQLCLPSKLQAITMTDYREKKE